MLSLGSTVSGKFSSSSKSLKSISIVRQRAVIGTSFTRPSKGSSLISPIISMVVKIHIISTVKGIICKKRKEVCSPGSISSLTCNSKIFSNPSGRSNTKIQVKTFEKYAYCLGKEYFLYVHTFPVGCKIPLAKLATAFPESRQQYFFYVAR